MNGLTISPFIAALPKVELHIHIEGALPPSLRWRLAQKNNVPLPYATYEDLLASYQVLYNHRPELNGDTGAPTFLETYFAGTQVLCTESDFYDLGMAYLTRAAALNVRYCEPFFDLQAYLPRGISAATVCAGYLRAKRTAEATHGIRSNWILCFIRDRPVSEALAAYEAAWPWARVPNHGNGKGEEGEGEDGEGNGEGERGEGLFHAVGLASNEYNNPPSLFLPAFTRAREDGLHITLHCDVDQKDAVSHIHEAIHNIHTERIDHGLNAVSSPPLLNSLSTHKIPLTLCPHAYHRRQATSVLFPKIRTLHKAGVKFSIGSDDPAYMHDVWVDGALQKVYTYCGFTKGDMVGIVRDAVEMSWADEVTKRGILDELDGVDVVEVDELMTNG